MIDFNNIDSIEEYLNRVKSGEISPRAAAKHIIYSADEYWMEGVKIARKAAKDDSIRLSDIRKMHKLKEFVDLVANEHGTYSQEGLKQQAIFLKRELDF
jgi:hypothetical protein